MLYCWPLKSVQTVLLYPGQMAGVAEEPALVVTDETGPVYADDAIPVVVAPIPFLTVSVAADADTEERLVLYEALG